MCVCLQVNCFKSCTVSLFCVDHISHFTFSSLLGALEGSVALARFLFRSTLVSLGTRNVSCPFQAHIKGNISQTFSQFQEYIARDV